MSQPPPQWLLSCLQDSHLSFALRTLDSREMQRESARIMHKSSPTRLRARLPDLNLLRPSDASRFRDYYSCSVGQQPAHRYANRYMQLEPYDRTRVLVSTPDHLGRFGQSDLSATEARYLNANWVREIAGGKWWIGGQAPLPKSLHAFLTLTMCPVAPPSTSLPQPIQARRVHTIVQLTQMVEVGRRRADPYFSDTLLQDMIITPEPGCNALPIHVRTIKEERIDSAQCVRTDLLLRWGCAQNAIDSEGQHTKEWKVTHLLYRGWPDFGVPEDNHSILNFAQLVERVNNCRPSPDPNESPPILVHCSAGVGRTGSFISLCSLLRAHTVLSSPRNTSSTHPKPSLAPPLPTSPLGPLPDALSDDLVAREIDGLREQRTSMVQRKEQVLWVYEALFDAFKGM